MPSYTKKLGSQKPDVLSLTDLSKGILHIMEAKNYSIEERNYINKLFNEIFEQSHKRITNSIGAYVAPSYSGLDKCYKIEKLVLDFCIDFKGHYKNESELESLKRIVLKKCQDVVEKLQHTTSSELLKKCSINFYMLKSLDYEEVLHLIDTKQNVFEIHVRDTDKRVKLISFTF